MMKEYFDMSEDCMCNNRRKTIIPNIVLNIVQKLRYCLNKLLRAIKLKREEFLNYIKQFDL